MRNMSSNKDKTKERFLEFLIDLEAQLPTRRYFNTLLHDHQILVLCKLSPLLKRKEGGELFKQLLEILKFYAGFEINDHTGSALTYDQLTEIHCKKLTNLQVQLINKFHLLSTFFLKKNNESF